MSKLSLPTPEWAEPLLEDARFKVAFSGRGAGKSYFFASLLIEEHIANPEQRSLCIRAVQNSIEQSVKQLIEELIYQYGVSDEFDIQKTEIRSKRGKGLMIFKGMQHYNSSTIKSFQGFDRAWIEEAADLSQSSWDDLEPTIRKPKSQIWASFNPKHETDPIDKLFRGDVVPENSIVVETSIFKNPWASEENMNSMEYARKHDPDAYEHIWLGKYENRSDARVIKNWRVEDFEAPDDAIFRQGADFGFSVDPSVLIRCYIKGQQLFIDYEAHQIGCEIINLPNLFLQVPDSDKWAIVADSSRPETISHLKKHGFPKIYGAAKGAKSLEEGIAWLNSFEIIVHPRCRATIDELTLYKYKIDKETNQVTNILEDKNNHCIDALRYACEGVRRADKERKPVKLRDIKTASIWK